MALRQVLIIHHVAVMACCAICLAIVEEGFGAFCMGVAIFEVQEPAIRKPDKAQQRVKYCFQIDSRLERSF